MASQRNRGQVTQPMPSRHTRGRGTQRDEDKRSVGKSILVAIREIIMVFVVAILISALIKTFLIQSFEIPSESMRDTLEVGDRILVSKLVPNVRPLNHGDIVVFRDSQDWLPPAERATGPKNDAQRFLTAVGLRPDDSSSYLIKRAIGLPGDQVACCDAKGRVTVNGKAINEPYLRPGVRPSDVEFSVTVPADHIWVMGDNRSNSYDSRAHQETPGRGFVPMDDVVGRAFVILWPVAHWTTLSNTDAFVGVPQHSDR
ncbi:MAG: signal peptidase I [Actinomycetaceae bacterium]|nr:signal peptidase I [Actinomycetaceae bacterium]MDU0970135.1 signal peptidase I [Actinomycetaceae bacterium]